MLECPLSPGSAMEGNLIGQSVDVPNIDVPDDVSALDTMSLNDAASAQVSKSGADVLNTQLQDPNAEQVHDGYQANLGHQKDLPSQCKSSVSFKDVADDADLPGFSDREVGTVRRSSLVSSCTSIDVSWFAQNGLMSRKSFEKYVKEMQMERPNVIGEDSRPLFLSKSARMNHEFDLFSSNPTAPATASDIGRKLLKSQPHNMSQNKKKHPLSKSVDNGLDVLVRSLIQALANGDHGAENERKVTMLKARLSDSLNCDSSDADGGQNKEKVELLTKAMASLINESSKPQESTKPENEDEGEGGKIQDIHGNASFYVNNFVSESSDRAINACVSSETLPRSNAMMPNLKFKFYQPKRKSSKVVVDSSLNIHASSNMSLSSSKEVQSDSETKLFGLEMLGGIATSPPSLDRNVSLTSIQPLNRANSSLTDLMCEGELQQQQQQQQQQVFSQGSVRRNSSVDARPRTPPSPAMSQLRRSSVLSVSNFDCSNLDGPEPKANCGDILAEAMEYLAMTKLVNLYGKLREMSILGHASVKFVDVDVNSHQRISRLKEMKRRGLLDELEREERKGYLDNTKTSEFVVRTVLDEYEMVEASSDLSPSVSQASIYMQCDASLLAEFKTWVEESKNKQLDSVTEELIKKLREECEKREMLMAERASFGSISSVNAGKNLATRRKSLELSDGSFQTSASLHQDKPPSEVRVREETVVDKIPEDSSDYFEDGSVMKKLLTTDIEVVWFSDRHPSDIIYCICVDRKTKTVTVLFRAQESIFNVIVNSGMTEYPNPISHEDYSGNSEFIKLRTDTADILRVRRDTKKSTIDEIIDKVEKIGYELDPNGNYHVSVAGHGMAGGIATVLGYYLAANSAFITASAIRVFSFASSRAGCQNFQSSFKHLEKSGRLLLARVTNSHDLSFLPSFSLDENWRFSGWYKDVGMNIRLHKSDYAGRQRVKQSLDVTYSTDINPGELVAESLNLMVNILTSLRALFRGGWNKNSRISVYQSRLHFAREYRLALAGATHRFDIKRKNLKTLHDYYLMKCRCVEDFAMFKKQKEGISWVAIFFIVTFLISFELGLMFRFVSKW